MDITLVSQISGILFGLVGLVTTIINVRRVRTKKIDRAVHDLIEALKNHQVGIPIPLYEKERRAAVERSIRTILEMHFKV